MTTRKDWVAWYKHYNDSESDLAKRLISVQKEIKNCLPENLVEKYQIIDVCAGDGRDLIPVLNAHSYKHLVHGFLVEIDQDLTNEAVKAARQADLGNLEFVVGDAALTKQYEDVIPADLIMLCGVFGNISNEDIENTIKALPGFSKKGSRVIWTRNRRSPDRTPEIRSLFSEAGFTEISFNAPDDTTYAVGVCEYNGQPSELDTRSRLFSFLR